MATNPSAWSEEQQKQLMQALMGGAGVSGMVMPGMPALPSTPGGGFGVDPIAKPDSANDPDPFAALMAQFQGSGHQPGMGAPAQRRQPPTLFQKLVPILHLLSVWTLLAYFILWKEPEAWASGARFDRGELGWEGMLGRWGVLNENVWGVTAVVCFPFVLKVYSEHSVIFSSLSFGHF